MDFRGPNEDVVDWLRASPVLGSYSKILVHEMRPFPDPLADRLRDAVAKLPGTEATAKKDDDRLRLSVSRSWDIIEPFCSELPPFFKRYPPGPRARLRLVQNSLIDYVGLTDETVVRDVKAAIAAFADGKPLFMDRHLTATPALACDYIARDIAKAEGVYKPLRKRPQERDEAKRLCLIIKALASIGIGVEKRSVGHVAMALSIISSVGDEDLIKGYAVSILEDMIDTKSVPHALPGAD